jgi:hypothetical protein
MEDAAADAGAAEDALGGAETEDAGAALGRADDA